MKIWIPNWLVNRIVRWAKKTPYFNLVREDGSTYMERWWLRKPAGHGEHASTYDHSKKGDWGARLHLTNLSDRDRVFHDHPWLNISIVLRGGYWEWMPADQNQHPFMDRFAFKRVWRGPGSIVIRRATHRHRLEIDSDVGPALSVFIMGPWRRDWGFHTSDGWVFNRDYLHDEAAAEGGMKFSNEWRITAFMKFDEERRPGITKIAIDIAKEIPEVPLEGVRSAAKIEWHRQNANRPLQ